MTDHLNVFEHQRFRLRTPEGERVSKSFRELLTEPDAAYALDYAQAFYDVAALSMMSYLAQAAFEPETVEELAHRLKAPMSKAEFERAIAPLRARFALTGDGPRFMQGPNETWASGSELIGRAVLSTHEAPNKTQDDKRFLNRLDEQWAVSVDQAALFLFTRNTFFPGMLGGHKKGTNGSNPVRTYAIDPTMGDALWLRRTIWLNVLAREQQQQYAGAYAASDKGYDGAFWIDPPKEDVPTGGITLRAGLAWMSDYYWLQFAEEKDFVCPMSGIRRHGYAARTMKRTSTRIGYGDSANSFFRHPNVATRKHVDKSDVSGEIPFLVRRTEGLAQAVGAAFFGGTSQQDGAAFVLAPVVSQVQHPLLKRAFTRVGRHPAAMVFGFHMLSKQKNVHGGIEQNTFALPLLGETTLETKRLMETGSQLVRDAGTFAEQAGRELGRTIKRMQGVDAELKSQDDGDYQVVDKKKNLRDKTNPAQNPDGVAFARDTLAAFWRAVQGHLIGHAGAIATAAEDGPDALTLQSDELRTAWEDTVIREVRRQYTPIFEHYSTLPRTMPYAHVARKQLNKTLSNIRSVKPEPQDA